MGQAVFIYRRAGREPSGAISDHVDMLVVINVSGPFEPSDDAPAFRLVDIHKGHPALIPLAPPPEGSRGPMSGGNYAGANNSDWVAAVAAIAGLNGNHHALVSIHDHYEWAGVR